MIAFDKERKRRGKCLSGFPLAISERSKECNDKLGRIPNFSSLPYILYFITCSGWRVKFIDEEGATCLSSGSGLGKAGRRAVTWLPSPQLALDGRKGLSG